jgi:DNA invertase Pin-like site-specific DNA recombinase
MLIGYERVSTDDQNLALQHDALQAAGCEKIFADKMSGAKADRPGLKEALEFARKGDTLVVWRLDRLGRSLKDLMALVEGLEQRTIGFRSLQESIDTTSSGGKLIFHMFGALAEFERNLIRNGHKLACKPQELGDGKVDDSPSSHRSKLTLDERWQPTQSDR